MTFYNQNVSHFNSQNWETNDLKERKKETNKERKKERKKERLLKY